MFTTIFQLLYWKDGAKIKIYTKEKSDAFFFIYLVTGDRHWF